tara:strand:+ start:1513 stop:1764 length:252 start_codon:yes stop_codon:yes gene_type:complete
MAARDYKKLYNELKALHAHVEERFFTLNETHAELIKRHSRLDDEFTKAVKSNKRYQEMLYEQRGVIGFLEDKIEKLKENLDDA